MYVNDAGHVSAVVDDALSIVKVLVSALAVWFASPVKLAFAVAVPAFVLSEYVGVTALFNPPTPVAAAVHGVSGEPVYVSDAGHVRVVVDDALSIVNPPVPVLPSWFASPAKVALALAAPAFVLLV